MPRTTVVLVTLLSVAGPACSGAGPPVNGPLRVGVLPDQSAEELEEIYAPLLAYLEQDVGVEFELAIPDSYAELLEQVEAGRVQLGWFGGLTFLRAERIGGMQPLVMRDVDFDFTSTFLVRSSSSASSIQDLAGKSIAFGSELSTSGNLMPRYFLREEGVLVDSFFGEIRHTKAHDETAFAVLRGEVDVGALSSLVVQAMLDDGRLPRDEVRILCRSPHYRDYVWAASPDLESDLRGRILDAFLSLDAGNPEHAGILDRFGSAGFLPASGHDYHDVRAAAEKEGLLEGDSS